MTTQSGKQERRKKIRDGVQRGRRVSETSLMRIGRLALFKGEGEGEGLFRTTLYGHSKPLTSVLSPSRRGEAEKWR